MVLTRPLIQVVALASVGLVLVLVGAYLYGVSATNAQNANNNCPANEMCPTAIPNSQNLLLEYLGGALLVVAAILGVIQFRFWRRASRTP
jgi:hypothetical protein